MTVGAVISGRPASLGFESYIDMLKDSPYVKGVRQVLHVEETHTGLCLAHGFVEGVQYLGRVGLSFDLCMRPRELMDGVKLAKQCLDTQFIVDHCGNADSKIVNAGVPIENDGNPFWQDRQGRMDAMSAYAALPNVVCKISGIVARAATVWTRADLAPTIIHCLDAFGPNRVVFGGDWPVCALGATYGKRARALREVISTRSEEDQRKLLHNNAERLYGLN